MWTGSVVRGTKVIKWKYTHEVGLLTLGSIHFLKLRAPLDGPSTIIHTYLGLGPTTLRIPLIREVATWVCLVAHSLTWPNNLWAFFFAFLCFWQLVEESLVVVVVGGGGSPECVV